MFRIAIDSVIRIRVPASKKKILRLTISVIGRLCGVHNRLINRLNRKHASEVRVEVAERRHNSRPNQSPVIVAWSLRGRKFPLHQLPNTRDEKEADLVHT